MDEQQPTAAGFQVAPGIYVSPQALEFSFSRSSGPGGQNVNKVNTKVELWVWPGDLVGLNPDARQRLAFLAGRRMTQSGRLHLVSQSGRTQEANRAAVLERLRELLVQAMHRPRPRRPTRPGAAARRRRLEAKRHRGQLKAGRGRPSLD